MNSKTILVVEDEDRMITLLNDALEDWNALPRKNCHGVIMSMRNKISGFGMAAPPRRHGKLKGWLRRDAGTGKLHKCGNKIAASHLLLGTKSNESNHAPQRTTKLCKRVRMEA